MNPGDRQWIIKLLNIANKAGAQATYKNAPIQMPDAQTINERTSKVGRAGFRD